MRHLIQSIRYAIAGILASFKGRNFKILFVCVTLVMVAAALLRIALLEWALLIVTCFMLLSFEMINTAIEKLCDHLHPDQHPAIGKIKDIAAGAVLLFAIAATITSAIILIPKIWTVISTYYSYRIDNVGTGYDHEAFFILDPICY